MYEILKPPCLILKFCKPTQKEMLQTPYRVVSVLDAPKCRHAIFFITIQEGQGKYNHIKTYTHSNYWCTPITSQLGYTSVTFPPQNQKKKENYNFCVSNLPSMHHLFRARCTAISHAFLEDQYFKGR